MRNILTACRTLRAALASVLLVPAAGVVAHADEGLADEGLALAEAISERPANEGRVGMMTFTLTNDAGKTRTREAFLVHSDIHETIRIGIYFTEPAMIADTAFMSFDHVSNEDENWLFLPATDRVRRLPSSDRGDYFMGTDLTYGDVKDDFKFGLEDWTFSHGGQVDVAGRSLVQLNGSAQSPALAKEMGYGSFEALIDPETLFPVEITYSDTDGDALKRVSVTDLDTVGGAWTAMAFSAENLQTGHRTEVTLDNMRYVPDLDDSVFDSAALAYGAPDIG